MTKSVNLFVLIILLLLPSTVLAANHYVRAGATGSNIGSDWTNAWTSLPASLTRGDTYYIADGTYEAYTFNDAVSGTSIITIKKATASDHGTETGWDSTYGDGQATFTSGITISTGYWVIDGGSRRSETLGHGFVIDTRATHSKGAIVTNANNSTLKYIAIIGGGPDGNTYGNDLLYSLGGSNYLKVQYCYFYNAGRTHILTRGDDNWLVEYCYFDTNESTAEQHSESFSCLSSDNWEVRFNTFINIQGTGVIVVGNGGGWKVHGNIFENYMSASNGIFVGWTAEPMTGGYFYNNTLVNNNYARVGFVNDTSIYAHNNLYINNTFVGFSYASGSHDNNGFSGSNNYGESNALTGLTSGIFVGPTTKNYRLSGGLRAGDASIGSLYNKDPDANTRGLDGTWDRGAFEYTVGGSKVPQPPNSINLQ